MLLDEHAPWALKRERVAHQRRQRVQCEDTYSAEATEYGANTASRTADLCGRQILLGLADDDEDLQLTQHNK